MSTRSFISMKNGDGYTAVYCHYDGYPEGVGKQLKENFTTEETVTDLIDLGNISYIEDGEPCAYHRDRGEDYSRNAPKNYICIQELRSEAKHSWAEYLYVFEDNNWYVEKL